MTWQNQQNDCAPSEDSDQPVHPLSLISLPLSAWRKLGPLTTYWAHSEDSDQTGRMPRLIWVFAGRTLILLVFSCRGSYLELSLHRKYRQCLSSFRISAHKLQIERGRYLGKIVEERKCTVCNIIENDKHFFCVCNKYNLELENQHLFLGNDNKKI